MATSPRTGRPNGASRFTCPACRFPIFNRRVATCESCGAALPAELLFTAQQLKVIDAEHQRNEQARKDLANAAKKKRRGFDSGDLDFDFGDSGAVVAMGAETGVATEMVATPRMMFNRPPLRSAALLQVVPASTAAIATAVASTFDEFNPATHMRPERST